MVQGLGIRGTARVCEVDPKTVLQWLMEAADHLQAFSRSFLCEVHVHQVQLDELYALLSAVKDGEVSEDEAIQRLSRSPQWVWVAMDPERKLLLAIDVGNRTLALAQCFVHHVAQVLAPDCAPLFLTDGFREYTTALLTHYGHWVQLLRRQATGPAPKPRWMPLPQLCYAQVVTQYRRRRLIRVHHRVVFGPLAAVQQVLASRGWQINTAFIERVNLTIRQHVAAVGRRVMTLCKGEEGLRQQLALYQVYYNFCLPHASLRQPLPQLVGPEYSSHGKALIYPSVASMLDHKSVASPAEAMYISSPRRKSFVYMLPIIHALLAFVASLFRSRRSLHLKVLALQHQVAVYQRLGRRPHLHPSDRLFWVWLSRLWTGWQEALVFVQPRTVIAWQRQRFREHWARLSQGSKPGRPAITKDIRDLIRKMSQANPTWGAPRIVGELRKLGIPVAKSTVEKYRVRPRNPPSPTWKAFLKNHVQDLVSLDFFVVPTLTHKVLFVLLILAHERRRVVRFNVTEHPTAQWTAQQVVEAFPWDEAPRYLLRDRDGIYGAAFRQRVQNMGIEEVITAPQSPWQNPYVERLIGSIRRECLDHVMVLSECHLQRLLTSYLTYYHRWRTHLSLDMDCPEPRPVQFPAIGSVRAVREVGGLHHHYERRAA